MDRWAANGQGVKIRGGLRGLVLVFSARSLGFCDAAHAARAGLTVGRLFPVCCVLFTQGIDAEQSMANMMRQHTTEQQGFNVAAVHAMRAYAERYAEHAYRCHHGTAGGGIAGGGVAGSGGGDGSGAPIPLAEAPRSESETYDDDNDDDAGALDVASLPESFIHSSLPTRVAFEASLQASQCTAARCERRAAASHRRALAGSCSHARDAHGPRPSRPPRRRLLRYQPRLRCRPPPRCRSHCLNL